MGRTHTHTHTVSRPLSFSDASPRPTHLGDVPCRRTCLTLCWRMSSPTAHTSSPCEEARYPASCACPWVNCCVHGAQGCLYVCVQVVVIVPAKGTGTASSSRPNQHRRTAGTGCCGFCSRRAKVVAMYAVAVQVRWWCFFFSRILWHLLLLLSDSVVPCVRHASRSAQPTPPRRSCLPVCDHVV